jgi:hypothetical protein
MVKFPFGKKMKFNRIFLTILILGLILGIWTIKRNIFSKEVLKFEILGQSEISVGEINEILVKFKNNGNFRLEDPELVVEFPEGTQTENEEILTRKVITKEEMEGMIYPGEEKSFSFKLKFFGKEGETKEIRAFLTYRPKNLKSFFKNETKFTFKLKVPLTFEIDIPPQIESEKEFRFNIYYFSHLSSPLSNLKIQAEWPSGFEFIDSQPKSIEQKAWLIPTLNKFEGKKIEILGKIHGEVKEPKIFKAKIGFVYEGQFIILKEISKAVEIAKSSIFVRQEINGNPEYSPFPGEWLHYEIFFKNVGEKPLENLLLLCTLSGDAFDFSTFKSDTGSLQENQKTIVFDWQKNSSLKLLQPLEEGRVDFWIKLKDSPREIQTPLLKSTIIIGQTKQEFITKLSSTLEFSEKGYFFDEVFGNSGPLPPKVGEKTTFTIFWQVKSTFSPIKDVKVKSKLPENVSLTGKIFPETEISKFSFDSDSREILWAIGDLNEKESKTLAFQIELLPQKSDVGTTPKLIEEIEVLGYDPLVQKEVKLTFPGITTFLKDDPQITLEKATVIK